MLTWLAVLASSVRITSNKRTISTFTHPSASCLLASLVTSLVTMVPSSSSRGRSTPPSSTSGQCAPSMPCSASSPYQWPSMFPLPRHRWLEFLLMAGPSYTARELRLARPAVWLVTLMVLCENSYTTISRMTAAERRQAINANTSQASSSLTQCFSAEPYLLFSAGPSSTVSKTRASSPSGSSGCS